MLPRVAVDVGYQRRWLVNQSVIDNRARAATDHTKFGVNIPVDSRLPGGGGGVLEGLYNVTPEAAPRLNDNFETLSSNYRRVVAPVGLREPECHRADAQRRDAAGRVQHRQQHQRLLRRAE